MIKPKLPSSEKLLPYLKRIDGSRMYSNFGPLNAEYQERLGEMFGSPCITGSSATSLITATLMAYDLPRGSLVAMPSWTFSATAAAVVNAGMVPYFVDVDEYGVFDCAENLSGKVSAVIVVAPFGRFAENWKHKWMDKIPIIVDAAAGFDSYSKYGVGKTPVIISTHSTKAFGTGEGGFLCCIDTNLLERVRRITNFGLTPDRRIEYNGLNAKFSEYHAAVGLASLDGWPEKRRLLLEAVKHYGLDYAVTLVPVRGQGVMRKYGCHIHNAYAGCPRTELPITNKLIANVGAVTVGIE